MGELARSQLSRRGPMNEVGLGVGGTRFVLPIFMEPVFVGHQTMNPDYEAGRARGGFAGEDSYGWGYHRVGVIDCVNLSRSGCSKGAFSLKSRQCWEELWKEHNPGEAVIDFLTRVVVQVRLDPNSIKRIPDPKLWNVEVTSSSSTSIQQTASSRLVLKTTPTEEGEGFRKDMSSARSNKIDFDEEPWVTNR